MMHVVLNRPPHVKTMSRRRELLLAHLFAAPLARENAAGGEEKEPAGLVPIKQRNYSRERDVITRALEEANRSIAFLSEVADGRNFLMNLTGCRVLHFTWNGDGDQDKVMFENTKGLAAPVTEDWLQNTCNRQKETLPEVVVLTAASAKLVAGIFVRAGISNVVAVETNGDDTITLGFIRSFYLRLAQGFTLRDSFDAGVYSLPDGEEGRCVLLPEESEHWVCPFDDAESGKFTYRAPRSLGKMVSTTTRLADFHGREIQVQEVYTHMVQQSTVITISGRPGIGKTEVALRACEYARERCLFIETIFVSLEEQATGAPITSLKDVSARIASGFGVSEQEVRDHSEGFLGCIQHKCGLTNGHYLLVLDGCSPYFVNEKNEPIKLSSVVERLCARVSKLQYIVTVITQVGIANEKVVNIGRLSELAAAELFVASSPREVTVEELRGGMVVSGPQQVQRAECMRLFAGGVIMAALERHPGAIIAASGMLEKWHLLTHEDEYLQNITVQLQRYDKLEQEFTSRLQECPQTQSVVVVEREWGSQARSARLSSAVSLSRDRRPPHHYPPAAPPTAGDGRVPKSPLPAVAPRSRPEASAPYFTDAVGAEAVSNRRTNGEFWWRLALEMHTGRASAISQTVPWEALCRHSLATYFLEVLGDEGRDRPLLDDDFQALGNNKALWDPYRPPGSDQGAVASRQEFLGTFWPWFQAATLLLKVMAALVFIAPFAITILRLMDPQMPTFWGLRCVRNCLVRTGCWGFQKYPVICGLTTTRFDGMKLLQGRPEGTFLLRLSSQPGALVGMYVKPMQELGNVLIKASTDPRSNRKFEIEYGSETMIAPLKQLIDVIPKWTHLFPDTPKQEALAGIR